MFFLSLSYFAFSVGAKTLNESLLPLNKKQSQFGETALLKNIEGKGEKKSYNTLYFELNGNKFELEIITPSTLAEFANNRKNISSMIIKSYQDQPTPYQGVITNMSKCPKKFVPDTSQLQIGLKEIFVVKSFVGSTFNHGICEEKLITYLACNSFYFDDKKSQYYKLKVFSKPKEDCTKLVNNFFENLTDL